MNKLTFSILIGNIIEFYDFILFGYLAIYLSANFFPNYDPYTGMMLTFSIFAGGCIVRPIGAFIFGHVGDTLGRKSALKASIAIASISTALVGVLPTYQDIGLLAPALLILLRLLQGFSVCGEETGAAIYLIESKQKAESGYASSLVLSSVYAGLALGSGIVFLTTLFFQEEMKNIGWRIPFLLAAPMGCFAYILRASSNDSPVFEKLRIKNQINHFPVSDIIKNHKKEVIAGIFNCALLAVSIYLFAVYFPSVISIALNSHNVSAALIFAVTLFTSIACPMMGKLTDKFGILNFYKFSIFIFIFLSPPVLFLATQKSLFNIALGYTLFGLMCTVLTGTVFAMLSASFKDDTRYSGVTISFNLSMTFFGSTAPMIALWLTKHSSNIFILPFQTMSAAVVAYIGLHLLTTFNLEKS